MTKKHYFIKPQNITVSQIRNKLSFSSGDYRILELDNSNIKVLKSLVKKELKGCPTNSKYFVKKSQFRFLKTNNISEKYLLDESIIEYSKPILKSHPEKGDILIAKDGAGEGLGECVYYNKHNKNNDTICGEILGLTIKDDKYYVLGMLKSQHFKDYVDLNTRKGSTLRHSKKVSLSYSICFPTKTNYKNPDLITEFVSSIVQNIIDKEEKISQKYDQINFLIQRELHSNQLKNNFIYHLPKLSDIRPHYRFDSGLYSKEFKEIYHIIINYRGGSSFLPKHELKGGNTPEKRIIRDNGKYTWITPTDITNYGCIQNTPKLNCHHPNIKEDCVIFINRTSKGKKGEYVGIAMFYDFNKFGMGHHNQGCYRLEKRTTMDKLFVTCFFNSSLIRKLCGSITIGSKMKEMKKEDFIKVPIPIFPDKIKQGITLLYYNSIPENPSVNVIDYLSKEKKRNEKLGIFQLNSDLLLLKQKLASLLDKIIRNEPINPTEYSLSI